MTKRRVTMKRTRFERAAIRLCGHQIASLHNGEMCPWCKPIYAALRREYRRGQMAGIEAAHKKGFDAGYNAGLSAVAVRTCPKCNAEVYKEAVAAARSAHEGS